MTNGTHEYYYGNLLGFVLLHVLHVLCSNTINHTTIAGFSSTGFLSRSDGQSAPPLLQM